MHRALRDSWLTEEFFWNNFVVWFLFSWYFLSLCYFRLQYTYFIGVPWSHFDTDFFHARPLSVADYGRHYVLLKMQTKSKGTMKCPRIVGCFNLGRSECSIQAAQNAIGCYALLGLSSKYPPRRDRNTIPWWMQEECVMMTRGRTMGLIWEWPGGSITHK